MENEGILGLIFFVSFLSFFENSYFGLYYTIYILCCLFLGFSRFSFDFRGSCSTIKTCKKH
jgi:hypothetical protein